MIGSAQHRAAHDGVLGAHRGPQCPLAEHATEADALWASLSEEACLSQLYYAGRRQEPRSLIGVSSGSTRRDGICASIRRLALEQGAAVETA